MEARKLRLLRIDDEAPSLSGHGVRTPRTTSEAPPESIELIPVPHGDAKLMGITGLASSVEFWTKFDPSRLPDLIISDVRFVDDTSPLYQLAADKGGFALPTGLSHFKPFAAISRAAGFPIGLALHSADVVKWNVWWSDARQPDRRAMAALAAHEILELAAIMRDEIEPVSDDFKEAWNWLANKKANNANDALPKALRDYRKRLKHVTMLPSDWLILQEWCRGMQKSPRVLDDENDPGFSFIRRDGNVEKISMRSLFADVEITSSFDFETDPLPGGCFEVRDDNTFFDLSADGMPKIGALIYACGDLAKDFEKAIRLLRQFPERDVPAPGFAMGKTETGPRGSAGRPHALAVLFRVIDQEWIKFDAWKEAYHEKKWRPRDGKFLLDERDPAKSLSAYVKKASKALQEEEFSFDEALGILRSEFSANKDACALLLKILESIGATERGADGVYTACKIADDMTPPMPPKLVKRKLLEEIGVPSLLSEPPTTYVQTVFGHHVTDRVLSRAIVRGFRVKKGGAFLHSFVEGDAPEPWKSVARDYAVKHLKWTDARTWPPSLK